MNIDYRTELEAYRWDRATWADSYLLACSPPEIRGQHTDSHPSFYVYFEDTATARAGYWGDRGTGERGSFTELIARLNGIGYDEAAAYLRLKYGDEADEAEERPLRVPRLELPEMYRPLDSSLLDAYKYRSPYLGRRSIPEAVQRLYGIGYDAGSRAVTIPLYNSDGTLANVKYRRTDTKLFWYAQGGRPIRELLFGLDVIYRKQCRIVAIVEAEIDAMTLAAAGFPAIATLGSAFNEYKADLIKRSPIEELVVVRDNDAAGRKWQRAVIGAMLGAVKVSVAAVPSRYKDVNETATEGSVDQVAEMVNRRRALSTINISLEAYRRGLSTVYGVVSN